MAKRTDINSILIIGAGPIIIGQACEFDYSGAQACKALREEGYKVILVNSNPATIMTDPNMADVTYIEPITWQVLENIIAKERPDAILPTMGGQTALNCALDLAKHGVLDKYKVEMIGASKEAIDKAVAEVYVGEMAAKRPEIWLYRGAWQEWPITEATVLVPLSQEELTIKIQAIFKHQSQKDSAPFPGQDEREFWQRVEQRNKTTAAQLDQLGLAEYFAMEAYVIA